MHFQAISIILGTFIGLFAFASLVLNIVVLTTIISGGFLKKNENNVYILTFTNVVGDIIHLVLASFYMAPSIVLQDFLFSDGFESPFSKSIAIIHKAQWYYGLLTATTMAISRFVIIVCSKYSWIFSRRNMIIVCCTIPVVSCMTAFYANFVLPCCLVYLYYDAYGFAYHITGYNAADKDLDLPFNLITSLISIGCYIAILVYLRRSLNNKISDKIRQKRRHKESRYALQFAMLSMYILFVWITFRIFPVIVPEGSKAIYSITTCCMLLNCSANSIIYLTMNNEFKSRLAINLPWKPITNATFVAHVSRRKTF